MVKPGYRTSEFWFTLVTFLFSGLYLSGIITDSTQKDDLIQETSRGLEATILIIGQLTVLFKYIKGRTELKKLWWDTATEEERKEADKKNSKPIRKKKRKTNANSNLSVSDIKVLVDQAKNVLQSVKEVAIPQAWNILQLATVEVIQSIENNSPTLKGADKKTLAMTMISNFYDQVFTLVNFPFVPKLLQPIIQKYVKQLLMLLVSASIDALVTTFRNAGIFEDPNAAVVPSVDKTPSVSDK